MPTISVIVPVYKVETYIHRCIDSILAQTYTDFELILVDDGSPDDCGAICDEYAAKDDRIYVIHQKNGGLSAARNAGIDWAFANSDSEWLTFVDSDDWVHPQYLSLLLQANVENHTQISNAQLEKTLDYVQFKTLNSPTIFAAPPQTALFDGRGLLCAYVWGRLIHKPLFRDIRFPVGKNWEDIFTTYRFLFQVEQVSVVDEKLYFYFTNPTGISNSKWNPNYQDEFDAYEELLSFSRTYKGGVLYPQILNSYAYVCAYQIDTLNRNCSDDLDNPSEYRQSIKKKLRTIIKQIVRNKAYLSRTPRIIAYSVVMLSPCLSLVFNTVRRIQQKKT